MRPEHRTSLTLAAVAVGLPLLASCADVLGLDEPTVREGAGGGTSASTSSVASTTAASSTTSTAGPGGGGPGSGGSSPGSSGTGGAGGEGGTGGQGGCNGPADCDDENPCTDDTCTADTCGNAAVADGPLVEDPEDCRTITCVAGAVSDVANDAEDPGDANPPCETTLCLGGAPVPELAPQGTTCGPPPMECDGAGLCIGCEPDDVCGTVTLCAAPTCVDEACDPGFLSANTTLPDPVDGDCQGQACTGSSAAPVNVADDTDLPADFPCGDRGCSGGAPTTTALGADAACLGQAGVCDGQGTAPTNCHVCRNTTAGQLDLACSSATPNCHAILGSYGDVCRVCIEDSHCEGAEVGEDCLSTFVCGCNADNDCFDSPNGDFCRTGADVCGCTGPADCALAARGDDCVVDLCGCDQAADCDGSLWGNQCIGGVCGCGQDADCATAGGQCNLTTLRCE